MNYIELDNNTDTHRVYKYRDKILKRIRNNENGNYSDLYTHNLTPFTQQNLKDIYGGNGDVTNISSSFLLKFPNAKFSDITQNAALKGQILSVFKSQDTTGVLSTFKIDTSSPNESELSIYINISWESSDGSAETQANALTTAVKNSNTLTNLFAALPVSSPFDVVELDSSLDAITIDTFVTSTIHSLVTTYNSGPDNTDIEIKTVGLYDHIGVKINSEDDNSYRRLRSNAVKTINIADINPDEDIIIATLFDKDYKKLYTSIQSPINFVLLTQGESGDILNENVNGSITLNLNVNDFIANNQADFITTMNTQTGGFTVVINVFSGSAIIAYKIIFDVTKTQQQINDVITTLNSDSAIQTLINTSATMNGITSTKTVGTTSVQISNALTQKPAIIGVKYDGVNAKIVFYTIGAYKSILYKATGQSTFLTTTSKSVDPPIGFTNQIDIKLVNVNDNDIITVATFTVDTMIPVITLNGDNPQNILIGNSYVEVGANVTDNSGDTLTVVITGIVDINTIGTYIISYNVVDSSGNSAIQVQRTVNIIDPPVPEYIQFNTSTVDYTYTGTNIVTVANDEITMTGWVSWYPKPSYLIANHGFDTNYATPWRFVFKIQMSQNDHIGIGWDSSQIDWGKPGVNTGDGGVTQKMLVIHTGTENIEQTPSSSYSVQMVHPSAISTHAMLGLIMVVEYDDEFRLNWTIMTLSGTVIFIGRSYHPYTYVNKSEAFHFFSNNGTTTVSDGMVYDAGSTATYKTFVNNIPNPKFIPFNVSTVDFAYTGANLVTVDNNDITMIKYTSWYPKPSYLVTNYNFDADYVTSWRFIFKVQMSESGTFGIGWDDPQTNWAKPGAGNAYGQTTSPMSVVINTDGNILAYRPNSSAFTITNHDPAAIVTAAIPGFIIVIDYDDSYILSYSIINLSGVIIFTATSNSPYTYVNKLEPFHLFINSNTTTVSDGMIYDSTRTATYNTLLNSIPKPEFIPFDYESIDHTRTSSSTVTLSNSNIVMWNYPSFFPIKSLLLNKYNFDPDFSLPWRFIIKVTMSSQNYIGIGWDDPQINWGKPGGGNGNGGRSAPAPRAFFYNTKGLDYPTDENPSNSFTVTHDSSAVIASYNTGFIMIIDYDDNNILSINVHDLSGALILTVTSNTPYTYVNKLEPFHLYSNNGTTTIYKGMIYDSTRTATYQTLLDITDPPPDPVFIPFNSSTIDYTRTSSSSSLVFSDNDIIMSSYLSWYPISSYLDTNYEFDTNYASSWRFIFKVTMSQHDMIGIGWDDPRINWGKPGSGDGNGGGVEPAPKAFFFHTNGLDYGFNIANAFTVTNLNQSALAASYNVGFIMVIDYDNSIPSVNLHDLSGTVILTATSNTPYTYVNKLQPFHLYTNNGGTTTIHDGMIYDTGRIATYQTLLDNLPPDPVFIQFNSSTIDYTRTSSSTVTFSNNDIIMYSYPSWFPIPSYLDANYEFDTNYASPWRFIIKVTMDNLNVMGIGWDDPQINWGKPGSGNGYGGRPDPAPRAFFFNTNGSLSDQNPVNSFTVTHDSSAIASASAVGFIIVIDYDDNSILSVNLHDLSGTVILTATSNTPYTYVNKLEPFHLYSNNGTTTIYDGMIYDPARTATYQTLLDNLP
jgi:hypothetical protein